MRNEFTANLMLSETALLKQKDAVKIGAHFAKPAPKRERKEKGSFVSRILGRKG